MPVSMRMPKCLVPVRLMNSMYSSTTSCLIGVGEWISGQMITSSSSASGRDASTTSVQIGCGTRSLETTPIFGPDEPEPEPLGQAQIALQRRGALLDGHVAAVRAAGVQAGVDPRAVVGGLEAVLLQQPEPVVHPLLRRVRVVRDVPLAEDLDAGRADVGDAGHRGLEVEHGAVVGHEAVEARRRT